jgi:hypothetical protein
MTNNGQGILPFCGDRLPFCGDSLPFCGSRDLNRQEKQNDRKQNFMHISLFILIKSMKRPKTVRFNQS